MRWEDQLSWIGVEVALNVTAHRRAAGPSWSVCQTQCRAAGNAAAE